jgi:hypothetical protein
MSNQDPQVVVVMDPNKSYGEQMLQYQASKMQWDIWIGGLIIKTVLILALCAAVVIGLAVWGSGLTDPHSKNSLKLDAHNAHVELDHALAVANAGPSIDVLNLMQSAQSAIDQHSPWTKEAVEAYNKAKSKEDAERAAVVAKAQAKADEADAKVKQ